MFVNVFINFPLSYFRWVVLFKSSQQIANHEQVIDCVSYWFISTYLSVIERIGNLLVDIVYPTRAVHRWGWNINIHISMTEEINNLMLRRKWGGINWSLFESSFSFDNIEENFRLLSTLPLRLLLLFVPFFFSHDDNLLWLAPVDANLTTDVQWKIECELIILYIQW